MKQHENKQNQLHIGEQGGSTMVLVVVIMTVIIIIGTTLATISLSALKLTYNTAFQNNAFMQMTR